MSGPNKPGTPWVWRDRAREFIVTQGHEGTEAAFKFFCSFRRMDKLKKAIKKEIDAAQARPVAGSGSSDSGSVPLVGTTPTMEDSGSHLQH